MAPGVGDLVLVGTVAGDVVGDDETLTVRVAERHEVFGAADRGGGQVRAVELGAGESKGCCDARQAVREIGHLRVGVGAEALRNEAPVRTGRHALHLGHEHVGGLLAERAGLRNRRSSGPQCTQQDPGCAEGDVVDAGVGPEARRPDDCLGPTVGRGQRDEPVHGGPCPGNLERGEYADGTDQPVEVGAVGLGRDSTADPVGDRARQALLFSGPGPSETDLSQYMGQTAHPAVHAVAMIRDVRDHGHGH